MRSVATRPCLGIQDFTQDGHVHVCVCVVYRALKTKHETPKYGLIYHASLIGQSAPKYKGKISRVLAAKCSLAIRVDALGDSADASIGIESRAKVRTGIDTARVLCTGYVRACVEGWGGGDAVGVTDAFSPRNSAAARQHLSPIAMQASLMPCARSM